MKETGEEAGEEEKASQLAASSSTASRSQSQSNFDCDIQITTDGEVNLQPALAALCRCLIPKQAISQRFCEKKV